MLQWAAMELSNWFGLAGSALLLFAPARDQFGRLLVYHRTRMADKSRSFGGAWQTSAKTHESQRNSFNFYDSITMAVGAIALGISFLL